MNRNAAHVLLRGLLPLVLVAACAEPLPTAEQPPRGPNVLLIVVDTLRADRCSFAGYSRATTPRLDEFARDAVVFRNAWSPTCWTPPAHATLFTGLRPESHGLMDGNRRFLPPESNTLAERLSAAGYDTFACVNNPLLREVPGMFQGFDEVSFPFHEARREPNAEVTSPLAVEELLARIAKSTTSGNRFFAFANLYEPHADYAPPVRMAAPFVAQRDPELVTKVRLVSMLDRVQHSLGGDRLPPYVVETMSDLYDGEVATADRSVGNLLDGLAELGVLDDTLVIVTSDHGEGFDEHGRLEHMHHLHSEVLRIPLMVRLPDLFDGGVAHDDVVRLEDVTATVAEVCNLAAEEPLDGLSLTADIPGRVARAAIGESPIVFDMARRYVPGHREDIADAACSAVDGRYHLIQYSDRSVELYDLVADPSEANDVSGDQPQVVATLRALLPW